MKEPLQTASAVGAAVAGLSFSSLVGYAIFTAPLTCALSVVGALAVATVVCRFLPPAPRDDNWTPVWTPHQFAKHIFRSYELERIEREKDA